MKSKVAIALLVILAIIGTKALIHPGFYTSHDGEHQIVRLMNFSRGLQDGQFPVRWAGGAMCGYGYPLFIFTYRLPFWVAEVYRWLSNSLVAGIKFSFILSFILSGLTMYWLASRLFSSKLAGLLAGFLYLWAPYRFVDIYVRAALGEAWAFVFMPLVFLGLYSLSKKSNDPNHWILLLTLGLSGLLLSHSMIFVIFLIPTCLWFLFLVGQTKDKKQFFFSSLKAGLISVLLTAYYWLPAAYERSYTKFSKNFSSYFATHFVSLKQLLYSRWGFGFDLPDFAGDDMSFQVGLAQWFVVAVGLSVAMFLFFKGKKSRRKEAFFLLFFLIIFVLSICLMLPPAQWFYLLLNKFVIIDFPWKFLSIAVFSAALLFAGIVSQIKNNFFKWAIIIPVLFLALYGNRNHIRVNQYTYTPESVYWASDQTSNEYGDYTPLWFSGRCDPKDSQLITLMGKSRNVLAERKSNKFVFTSNVLSNRAKIATKIAYYPGWLTYIDGKQTKTLLEKGRIIVNLDRGDHRILLKFRETNLRKIADFFSIAGLLLVIYLIFKHEGK